MRAPDFFFFIGLGGGGGLHGADCLSARAGAAGFSQSRDSVIHSTGRYSEESSRIHHGINNISVKSCEWHSN